MVFFSSCASVKYHEELLNYIDLPVISIHVCFYKLFQSKFLLKTRIYLIAVENDNL